VKNRGFDNQNMITPLKKAVKTDRKQNFSVTLCRFTRLSNLVKIIILLYKYRYHDSFFPSIGIKDRRVRSFFWLLRTDFITSRAEGLKNHLYKKTLPVRNFGYHLREDSYG